MPLKRMLYVTLALLFLGGTLTACNTIEGIGEDISSAGRYVKDKVFQDDGDPVGE